MEKKEYIEPEMNIVNLRTQELILSGSGDDEEFDGDFGSIKNPTNIARV
jgi:hypothetical protein